MCMLVCLTDRTMGDVLSSWTNFWHPTILPFEKEPLFTHSLPSTTHRLIDTRVWLHTDSGSVAAVRSGSHSRGVSLGMLAEPGGRERAAGKQWARHLSCVAALSSTHNGARRVASGAFLFSGFPFRGQRRAAQWPFCPLPAFANV